MNFEVGQTYKITSKNNYEQIHNIRITRRVGEYVELKYLNNNADYSFAIGGSYYKKFFWELLLDTPTTLGKYELEFMIELALATHDKEWFNQLTKQMEVSQ